MKNFIKFFLPALFLGLVFNACIKEDFDQPPTEGADPGLVANTTIKQLKNLHVLGQLETITEDLIVKGTVIADDASGNLYQSFIIQDSTAGIVVKIETSDSYTLYPVGREVYIKCKGLVLGDYNNLIQLGGFITSENELGNIVKVSDHLIRGKKGELPAAKLRRIAELTADDISTLVTVTDVQFLAEDTTKSYADAVNRIDVNRDVEDCSGVTLIVRTSGFAIFAGNSLADGNGNLTGVLGVFRDDLQFLIRDLNDVQLNGTRCGNGTGGGDPCAGGSAPIVNDLNEDFESGANNDPVALSGWTNYALKGSRTWQFKYFSDEDNTYAQATAYNDSSPEMDIWLVSPRINLTEPEVLSFRTATAFNVHDGFTAWISTDFECDPTTATWIPLNATLANPNSASNAWVESGDIDLSALVGQKIAIGFHYVGSGPSGQTSTYRVDDVKLGTGGGNPDPCNGVTAPTVAFLDEDFTGGTSNAAIAETGWTGAAVQGSRLWIYKNFNGNDYAQATAFNDTAPNMESWMVTPLVNVTGLMTLSFETAKSFYTHDGLSVLISTDFTCDPTVATWVPISGATIAGQANVDNEWIFSGDIDLSAFIGQKIAIGFKYVGSGPSGQTGTFRVDNVVVQ